MFNSVFYWESWSVIKREPQNAPNVPGMLEKGQQKGLPVATPTFTSLLPGPAWSEDRDPSLLRRQVGLRGELAARLGSVAD